jgi:hypothetical protein
MVLLLLRLLLLLVGLGERAGGACLAYTGAVHGRAESAWRAY